MKIAMIGQKGIPTLFGGVERHVEKISLGLASKSNFDVFVYTRPYYTSKTLRKYKKINLVSLPSVKTKHLDAVTHDFLATFHAIFKLRADTIHYHGIGSGLVLWIPKLLAPNIKVVFTFHCRDYFHLKWGGVARAVLRFGEKIACSWADELIVISQELKDYVEKKHSRRTFLIPHGTEREEKVLPKNISKWGLKKHNYILVVSRLIKHKGIQRVIEAYKKISTDKKLVIVGPSFYTSDYENKIKEEAESDERILFLGEKHGRILKEIFSNAYCFVNASEQEGLPLAVLEAASLGRALLLSDIEIHRNMLTDLPFFFKNKNTDSLKRQLDFLLRNPNLVLKRGRQTKKYAETRYNWKNVVEEIILRYS